MGRSLKNNLFNMDLEKTMAKALSKFKVKLDSLYELEPDAGLGNGGLGRLAACFLDGLSTGGYPAMGYCIKYEFGIFRQKLIEGWQTEMPDFWLPGGGIWLEMKPGSVVDVNFDGEIKEKYFNGDEQVISAFKKKYISEVYFDNLIEYDLVELPENQCVDIVRNIYDSKNFLIGDSTILIAATKLNYYTVVEYLIAKEEDAAAAKLGQEAMLPRDIIECLSDAFKILKDKRNQNN